MVDYIQHVIEFLDDVVKYLHSWMCTKDGEYKPCSIKSVRNTVTYMLASQKNDIINAFKNGVNDGSIVIYPSAFGFADNVKTELYKRHLDTIKKFEEKYHINNEEHNK